MKDISYYTDIGVPYPRRQDFTKVYAYANGQVVWSGSNDEWSQQCDTVKAKLVEKTFDEDAFKAAQQAYHLTRSAKYEEFKRDLFELHDVTGHPKVERCFSMAWNEGHSAGYAEVANVFDRLVELIKD